VNQWKKTDHLRFYSYLVDLIVPREVWKTANFRNFICCSFSTYSPVKMEKCVIFRKHAIARTLINQIVIDIEGCDKHEIEAFVKSFNLICLKTNFLKFLHFKVIQNIFEIWIFKKPTFLKCWRKKSPTLFIILASYGKFHSGIWMLKIWFTWHGMTHRLIYFFIFGL
jgi:hypothetical protein